MIDSLPLTTIPKEHAGLRSEIKSFLSEALKNIPPEVKARTWMGHDIEFSRKLAARGWIGLTLPKEYGGASMSPMARFVVVEELLAAGAPVAAHWIADRQSGPLLLKYGTEEQKRYFLPKICKAEIFFCIGMSEPNSGSDLASVKTKAVRNEAGWILSGQKIWTTYALRSQYMIALVRTSNDAENRHGGLSQVLVDLSLPGVTIRPIRDLAGDEHFYEVFFDDVQLPADALIGEEGAGWQQVTEELAFERSGPERLYSSVVLLDTWLDWLRSLPERDDASIELAGKLTSHLVVLREMSISITEKLVKGMSPVIEAALVKDMGNEIEQLIPTLVAGIIASNPDLPPSRSLLKTLSYITYVSPSFSLRGGTREILRSMIARGLGIR